MATHDDGALDAERQAKEGAVVTTIHQAKGLEWDTVFACHLEEGTAVAQPKFSDKASHLLASNFTLLFSRLHQAF
eukprot:6209962-Pleurochrysis_carterae.AAC.2